MTGEARCRPIRLSAFVEQGPAATGSISEAARIINSAKSPVILLGLMASKPKFANAIRNLLSATRLPVVGTFQAAGAVCRGEFPYFGGRVGQLANQPADALLDSGDCNRPVIHINVSPANIENDYSPAVELIGNIEETLTALSSLIHRPQLAAESAELLQRIAEDRERLMAEAARKSGVPFILCVSLANCRKY
jgi:acetolactate synthase-1/2/3 large subunit